jgi:hypothetical protein
MNTLTYLIGVSTPQEMNRNTTQPINRINDNVLNTPIIQTPSPEVLINEFDTLIPSSPEIEIPSHEELEKITYKNYVKDFQEFSDSERNDILQAILNDNEYLKNKPDESTEGLLSKKESNDIAIEVLIKEYHAQIPIKPRLSDDQIESIQQLTHKEYVDATNEERMQLINKLISENEKYSKLQMDEAKKSIYINNIIMDYLLNVLGTNIFTVDENINLKKEDSILEEDSVSDEYSIRDSPIHKLEEEVTESVVKELSEVDDPINKLQEMKEDLSNEIEQLVEEAEVTTNKSEQKQIEEKFESVFTTVEVVNTLLHELNEEVDSPPLPSLIPSPKPS